MPLGLARDRNPFLVMPHNQAGFALGRCTPGVGKIWERVPTTFLDPTSLALNDCIPYHRVVWLESTLRLEVSGALPAVLENSKKIALSGAFTGKMARCSNG